MIIGRFLWDLAYHFYWIKVSPVLFVSKLSEFGLAHRVTYRIDVSYYLSLKSLCSLLMTEFVDTNRYAKSRNDKQLWYGQVSKKKKKKHNTQKYTNSKYSPIERNNGLLMLH